MLLQKKVFYNWRMNGSRELLQTFAAALKGRRFEADIVLFVPHLFVEQAVQLFSGTAVSVGGQDCSEHTDGKFTGDVSARMLQEVGATHVLLHHSDRRQCHDETATAIANKAEQAVSQGLSPVVCLGETEAERDQNLTRKVLQQQLAPLLKAVKREVQRLTLVYEPVWAQEVGDRPTPGAVTDAHQLIRHLIAMSPHGSNAMSTAIPILSATDMELTSAQAVLALRGVDGALVSGADVDVHAYIKLLMCCESFALP
jgi:triosephosphate isomerase (TIM)